MSAFTIKSNQLTEVNFIVKSKNLSDDADVRFVIHETNHDITIHCKNIKEDNWLASIPPFHTKLKEAKFHIEVVSDEYLFKPISGVVSIVNTTMSPVVEVNSNSINSEKKVLIENFKPIADKNSLIKTISSSSKILETANNILKNFITEPEKIHKKSLLSVIEASKKALNHIENHID